MDEQELLQMNKNDLVEVCKSYGHRISGNKIYLVAHIKLGINVDTQRKETDLDHLARSWFMKPLAKRHCLGLGAVNGSCVLQAVKNIHIFDSNVSVQRYPLEFGLVHRTDKPWLATLVDGFLDINVHGVIHPTDLEIKTMSSSKTLAYA